MKLPLCYSIMPTCTDVMQRAIKTNRYLQLSYSYYHSTDGQYVGRRMPTSQNPWFIKRSAIAPSILKSLKKKLLERYWYSCLLKKGHGTPRDNRQHSLFVLGRSQVCISSQPPPIVTFCVTFVSPKLLIFLALKKNTRKLVTLNKRTL